MDYQLDMGAWNAVFAVPCSLVDRHLKLAGKEQLQAILWVLRHAGETFRTQDLAAALGISEDRAQDALEYWRDRGLLAARDGVLHPVPQPEDEHPAEKPETSPERKTPGPETAEPPISKELPPKKRMVRPDADYLAARVRESADIRSLLQEAEATLGLLSPAMTATLLASCDDYGLPVEVVAMLIHYAKEAGKTSTAYIDSVARDWAQSGIFTLEAAEEKLRALDERRLAWGKVAAAAGISKRSPSKKEEETAWRWVYQWKFSQEMLSAAYERCVDNTGKFSMAYMDKVLGRWEKDGLRTPQELEQAEQARNQRKTQEQQDAKSYDIDELERMSFFDLPEEL